MTIDIHGETATIDEYRAARDNHNGMLDHLQDADRKAFIGRVFRALTTEDRKTVIHENEQRQREANFTRTGSYSGMGRLD